MAGKIFARGTLPWSGSPRIIGADAFKGRVPMTVYSIKIDLVTGRHSSGWLAEFTSVSGLQITWWTRRGLGPEPVFRSTTSGRSHLWNTAGAVVFELMGRLTAWGVPAAFARDFGLEIVADLRERQLRGEAYDWGATFVFGEGAIDEPRLREGSMLPLWGEFAVGERQLQEEADWRAWSTYHRGIRDGEAWSPLSSDELEILARREAGLVGPYRGRLVLPIGWHVNSVLAVAEKGGAV